MDDWHRKLARDLVSETPAGFAPDAAAALEIAFGQARSAIAYVLELARAHRIPATGSVLGDDVWLMLGDDRLRFTLNRREGHVAIERPAHDGSRVRWDESRRAICHESGGAAADVGAIARDAIDAMIAAWRTRGSKREQSAPPPELDDIPTKA